MRRFRNIWFALAGLLWLPAAVHCQLESVPGLDFLRCAVAEDTRSGHNPDTDCSNCCALEKSQYRAEHRHLSAPRPELLPAFLTMFLPDAVLVSAPDSAFNLRAAPPDLPQRWHFLSRTALPVRAPSLVS